MEDNIISMKMVLCKQDGCKLEINGNIIVKEQWKSMEKHL